MTSSSSDSSLMLTVEEEEEEDEEDEDEDEDEDEEEEEDEDEDEDEEEEEEEEEDAGAEGIFSAFKNATFSMSIISTSAVCFVTLEILLFPFGALPGAARFMILVQSFNRGLLLLIGVYRLQNNYSVVYFLYFELLYI